MGEGKDRCTFGDAVHGRIAESFPCPACGTMGRDHVRACDCCGEWIEASDVAACASDSGLLCDGCADHDDPATVERNRAATRGIVERLGFYLYHTGGGCEAFRKDVTREDGRKVFYLVTESSDPSVPCDPKVPVGAGLYLDEDEVDRLHEEKADAGQYAIDGILPNEANQYAEAEFCGGMAELDREERAGRVKFNGRPVDLGKE